MSDLGSVTLVWIVATLLFLGMILMVRAMRRPSSGFPKTSSKVEEDDIPIPQHRLDRIRGIKPADTSEPSDS